MRLRRYNGFVVGVLALALLAVPLAEATETTRDEYTAAVEPICKASTQAIKKILKGVKGKVKAGKLKPAATQFAKAATALKKTWRQLGAVPQPAADEARLAKWLGYVKTEAELFQSMAKKLKAGDKAGVPAMEIRLVHNANLANSQVFPFDFTYCKSDPSKFT
jgi:hypothetical protein